MIRTIYFYFFTFIYLLISLIQIPRVNFLGKKKDFKAQSLLTYKTTSKWAGFILKLTGSKITVKGLENIPKDQTILIISNHQSYFDIPLIMSQIPVPKGFIAKKELGKWFGIRVWMKEMQCVFMDRHNMRSSAEAIVQGINILKNGHSMVVFPEGTRSKGGPTHEFKAGSFKLATKSKVPILPVTIEGTYDILEGHKKGIHSANITLTIHKLIDVASMSQDELKSLPDLVESTILAPLNQK